MSSELIAAWITAAATAVTAFAVFWVERSRRGYERRQAHFEEIKEFVLRYLDGVLVGHYLPILEGQSSILKFGTTPIFSDKTSSTKDPMIGWKPVLVIQPEEPSIGASFEDHETWQKHKETYPYLYPDAKENHFPELFGKWESFKNEFESVGQQAVTLGEQMAKLLEEKIKLPLWTGWSQQETWVSYFSLSNFIYRWLWGSQTGTLNIYEQSGNWVLQEGNEYYARGAKEQMEYCRSVVDELWASEKESVQLLRRQALRLLPEANAIKEEIQQLLLRTDLPGCCKFI